MSEVLEAKLGMHQVSALSNLLFEVVVDIVTLSTIDFVLCELLHAYDLVPVGEIIVGLRSKVI